MLQEQNLSQRSVEFSQKPRIFAEFITTEQEIRSAQKMRYEVFCEEYKVELPVNMVWNGHPIDIDDLDDHCLHLVVRSQMTGEIIGANSSRLFGCNVLRTVVYFKIIRFDLTPM